MKPADKQIQKLLKDDRGLSTVEYIIILCLICIVAFAAWKKFGETVKGKVGGANDQVETLPTESEAP